MSRLLAVILIAGLGCGSAPASPATASETTAGRPPAARTRSAEEPAKMDLSAKDFLKKYFDELRGMEIRAELASWKAATQGGKEDYAEAAETSLAIRRFHSDAETYKTLQALIKAQERPASVEARALEVAERAYRANQLPAELLKKMVDLSTEIEQTFSTFRAEIDGKPLTNNDLLDRLRKEKDSTRRRQTWEALKQVGGAVAPKLVQLARFRNEAARKLGFANYWEMQIHLQEHDPKQLLAIFDELDRLTRAPFAEAKQAIDRELAERFGVEPEALMPWHYDNPFFQAAPPSTQVDLDEFYEGKTREEIVEISRRYFGDVGLPVDEVLKRSDLYERKGKSQHAFCTSIDRAGDVRILCNIRPTAEWMEVTLHELGHAVYDLGIDRRLPFNLRSPSHAFTTEGVAMLFGALAKDPRWLVERAGADRRRVDKLATAILQQRRREQLVFARWTLVMLHFEKALYENPDRELNALWSDHVERYQGLRRPAGRNAPDWAAKPHFTGAPVYYHNYMLGELFAAQLRHAFAARNGKTVSIAELDAAGRKRFGEFLTRKVFRPGDAMPWPKFVRRATGEPLTARYFAAEVDGD